jgi:hypothetical protein
MDELVLAVTAEEGPCPAATMKNLPVPYPPPYVIKDSSPAAGGAGTTIVLGIEGSANKVGVGIVRYDPHDDNGAGSYHVLANPRKTFIAETGQGFLPKETAWHHQHHIVALIRTALTEAQISPDFIAAMERSVDWRQPLRGTYRNGEIVLWQCQSNGVVRVGRQYASAELCQSTVRDFW